MNIRQLFLVSFVVLTAMLMIGCTQTVAPDDVYRADVEPDLVGARNITVEQIADGIKVSGSAVSLVAITKDDFQITVEPEDTEVEYTMGTIEISKSGVAVAKANIMLGEDSNVPAHLPAGQINMFPIPPQVYELFGLIPGAAGSQNVSVKINEAIGYTEVAGLKFTQETTVNVWPDGVVEIDKQGVEVLDKSDTSWISKKVKIEDKTAVIMVKKQ